jgi:hypothetical protein
MKKISEFVKKTNTAAEVAGITPVRRSCESMDTAFWICEKYIL